VPFAVQSATVRSDTIHTSHYKHIVLIHRGHVEGGTKALKTFIENNGVERSLDLLAKISAQASLDAEQVTEPKCVPTSVSIVVEVIITLHCCISFISTDHVRTGTKQTRVTIFGKY